jgi:quercetin dioxygenase-like cupin family protein
VKVIDVVDAPHTKGHLHDHKVNRVMIYLQAGRQNLEYQDGRKVVQSWKPGEVLWSKASGMHTSEITSDQPVRIIEVELKNQGSATPAGSSPLDPVKVYPKAYKVEFENNQVRVLRVKFQPHESVPMHEHTLNRVTVFLTDQKVRMTDAAGAVTMSEHKAGDAAWAGPVKHKEQNLSDKPLEIVVVEPKL